MDSMLEPDEIVATLDIKLNECKEAFEELEFLGCVVTSGDAQSPIGYARARLNPSSFIQFVGQIFPDIDIVDEIKRTLNAFPSDGNYISSDVILESAKVPAVRLQQIIYYLQENNLIEAPESWIGEGKL